MREALHPSLPFVGVEPGIRETIGGWTGAHGPYAGVDPIGTAVLSPWQAETWFRIRFERGEVLGRYGWVGGKLMALDADLDAVMPTRFLPTADGAATFDPFTGKTVPARLDGDTLTIGGVPATRG
jgi:hypothetical protein